MVVVAAQGRDHVAFGHHAGGALGVLAAHLHAFPVAGVLYPAIEGEWLSIDGQQVVATIAASETHIQVRVVLL